MGRVLLSSGRNWPYFWMACLVGTENRQVATWRILVVLVVKDSKNGEEQVNDVQVQADSGGDLLLDVELPHDELGVNEDVDAEDEGSDAAVDKIGRLGVGQEDVDEAEDDEAPERAESVGDPAREVILRLASESSQEDEDASSDDECVKHNRDIIE